MMFDLQLLSNLASFVAMASLLASVYFLKDAVRLVSQSIHNSVRWDFLHLSFVLILLNVLFSVFSIYSAGPSYYDPAFFLWRNVFLILGCLMLLTVTFQLKQVSASNRLPLGVKIASLATAAAGLFLSYHSFESAYSLHHAFITFSYVFLGLSTAFIAVYARQFAKLSRVHATLSTMTYFIFASGMARILLYSEYSPLPNPSYANAGLNLAVYAFLAVLGIFAAYTVNEFKDAIFKLNLKRPFSRENLTPARKREIIDRISRRSEEE